MSAPDDPRIWQGLRAHLDELGSLPTVPPLGTILARRPPRRWFQAVAGLAGASAIVLAIGFVLQSVRPVNGPISGATAGSSLAPATSPGAAIDPADLVGHAFVAIDVTEDGQSIGIVPETRIGIGFSDASHFGASAGCNGMGGVYEIRDHRLVTADVYMTMKGCLGELGQQESRFYTFLLSSPTISGDATRLVLTSGDTVMAFVDESLAPAAPARMLTWVAVRGPADSLPPEDLVLEIGGMAWYGYGGVVSLPTTRSTEVRLVGEDTCRTYANFLATSGSSTVIRFSADGQIAIEDWTDRGVDAGPALAHRQMSDCPVT
jgi:heat shock protein HslJ